MTSGGGSLQRERSWQLQGGALLFDTWTASDPARELTVSVPSAGEYVPGRFFERELPSLLALLSQIDEPLNALVVDGYVWLARDRPGLGFHLWEACQRRAAVVGVAKNPFAGNDAAVAVTRGDSSKPLYVTAAGMAAEEAADHVRAMHGPFRLPTLLKRVDSLCRTARPAASR